jgi:hypothetical protein
MALPWDRRVPCEIQIETDEAFPDFCLFLHSTGSLKPIALAPGQPYRIETREALTWAASVVAVPRTLASDNGQNALAAELDSGKVPPGVLRLESIVFRADLPFYDTRERVIDRYRLESDGSGSLRLVWLGRNEGSRLMKGAWAVAGLLASGSILWLGFWCLHRLFRSRQALRPKA